MTRLRLCLALIFLCLAFVLSGGPRARADNVSPLLVEIEEIQPGIFSVHSRSPPNIAVANRPGVEMPKGCVDVAPRQGPGDAGGRRLFRCADGLRGQIVGVRFPQYNPSIPTIFRLSDLEGARISKVMEPGASSWTIPARETWSRVARDYAVLGMEHILASPDHLLFLVCLLWIAGTLKRVLVTVTGFTLAHSVSLALSALKVVHIPEAPVEIAIALSILFLAREAAVGKRDSLTWRYPVVISSSFGLLHGLGFAAALMEVGLPQKELVAGLLFFNVGVELGQIVFILVLVAGVQAFRRLRLDLPGALIKVPVYTVGAMSAFWTIKNAWQAFVGPI